MDGLLYGTVFHFVTVVASLLFLFILGAFKGLWYFTVYTVTVMNHMKAYQINHIFMLHPLQVSLACHQNTVSH